MPFRGVAMNNKSMRSQALKLNGSTGFVGNPDGLDRAVNRYISNVNVGAIQAPTGDHRPMPFKMESK